MFQETLYYQADGVSSKGYIAYQEKTKKPAIIVIHAWMGQDEFARQKADALAHLGYVGFAADIYGEGKVVNTPEKALELMTPLFLDRKLLQTRIQAAFNAVASHPAVEASKIGAIGFCFGGLTAIELLRSGSPVKGVVSFHATLANQLGNKEAKTVPIASKIEGSLLILHGYNDPMVSQNDLTRVQKELDDANVDWELDIYGHTVHAFTNPEVHDFKAGLAFNPLSSARAWLAMKNFFEEVFK